MAGVTPPPPVIWTVGHSNHEFEAFAELVKSQRIAFLVDVRSYPFSRFAPHFNRDELQPAMARRNVEYLFLGSALGGRPEREEHYDAEGHALYGPMAQEPAFTSAIDRLLHGVHSHRLALLCSCGSPVNCHRRLLIGRVLCERGAELRHILPNGAVQVEQTVTLDDPKHGQPLFGDNERPWRSTQSVSHRRRLSTSLGG